MTANTEMAIERYRIDIEGLVQGIGFRPFIYHLAKEKVLTGWVSNNCDGVQIEVQGQTAAVHDFIRSLAAQKPEKARIHNLRSRAISLLNESEFVIRQQPAEDYREKSPTENTSVIVLPDLAPCEHCLREIFDPGNRRYRYPFTHCTQCGPRFSMMEALPYDRANTGMKHFALCGACNQEYQDPNDRRFHAEANACPDCGPQLALQEANGKLLAVRDAALAQAVQIIQSGEILALKSVGGFQLIVDAGNSEAVARLRERKHRPAKPFALMYPDIEAVIEDCRLSALEQQWLCSAERPIVLLAVKKALPPHIAHNVAPGNPNLGIMLPCSPLHYLLLSTLKQPVVATSGNLGGEPICYNNETACQKLGGIADAFLLHNRLIARPLDDSLVRVIDNAPVILRRARGYAPLPVYLHRPTPPLLAVGGQLKSTVAVAQGHAVHISQHLGDLENKASFEAFEQAVKDLSSFYNVTPNAVVHDLHPTYASTQWAEAQTKNRIQVQHHVAHFFSAMAEQQHNKPALGVCWDGAGYGNDGIVWGGEFFHWKVQEQLRHIATMRAFPLPGGGQAIREPRRCALGLLYEMMGEQAFSQAPHLWRSLSASAQRNLFLMLARKLNAPNCSSVGRLFDAVAALLGLATHNEFEGQAAMALEFAAQQSKLKAHYPFQTVWQNNRWVLDWAPVIVALLEDIERGIPVADIAALFHNTLAQMIFAITQEVGEIPIFLSGGVFQNKKLTETTAGLLRKNGYSVYCHRVVPPNDGGLALGQIYYALCMRAHKLCA